MTTLAESIRIARTRPGFKFQPPVGLPTVAAGQQLPADLQEFYGVCGGLVINQDSDYPLEISAPDHLESSNLVIAGEEISGDITSQWRIIATGRTDEFISIDLSPARIGRCYDSFADRHGVAGSCLIIALSFTELLTRIVNQQDQRHYWLQPDYVGHGDAYD